MLTLQALHFHLAAFEPHAHIPRSQDPLHHALPGRVSPLPQPRRQSREIRHGVAAPPGHQAPAVEAEPGLNPLDRARPAVDDDDHEHDLERLRGSLAAAGLSPWTTPHPVRRVELPAPPEMRTPTPERHHGDAGRPYCGCGRRHYVRPRRTTSRSDGHEHQAQDASGPGRLRGDNRLAAGPSGILAGRSGTEEIPARPSAGLAIDPQALDETYRPPHRQLAASLLQQSDSGELTEGQPLPSGSDLTGAFAVRTTGCRAIAYLQQTGAGRTIAAGVATLRSAADQREPRRPRGAI
jgi:hypothetical protein